MMYGFCIQHRNDMPVDGDRRCLADGSVTIPPSWAKRGWRWNGEGWEGDTGRPEGYHYRPRFVEAVAAANGEPVTVTCLHAPCGATFQAVIRSGKLPRYCPGRPCKSRAANARRAAGNANLRQFAGVAP